MPNDPEQRAETFEPRFGEAVEPFDAGRRELFEFTARLRNQLVARALAQEDLRRRDEQRERRLKHRAPDGERDATRQRPAA